MNIHIGNRELDLPGKYIDYLEDSTPSLNDPEALRARMEEKGYLLLRGVHDRDLVLQARRQMLEVLAEEGQLEPDSPLMDGVVKSGQRGGFRGGQNRLTTAPAFIQLVRTGNIIRFFERFLGAEVLTYDYRWLRVVAPGAFTGAHYDVVYMGRGTLKVYTTWTPLGDTPIDLGPLAILEGSHRFEKIKETYGKMDVDRDHVAGWFSSDPVELVDRYGGQWKTHDFRAGDVLVFGMFTMHASLNNRSNRFRITSDTRYQLASEPVDERWIGENPKAHYAWHKTDRMIPMEEMRQKWGV
ncbi:MAG: phytanoyl-CoA dioxygenase family protein [Planctomycetes bacterium]|nr:phytanoyl-CoA dioxygenase family protein [Planctomycetota bacterium]